MKFYPFSGTKYYLSFPLLELNVSDIHVLICSHAAWHEGGCREYFSSLDVEANHQVAVLCFLGWGHVVLASKQHMSLVLMSLKAFVLHYA